MKERKQRTDLENALWKARVEGLDDRGLMPLDRARETVRKAREFARGRGRRKGSAVILDCDVLWAALLSLKDAREFIRHARRIEWTGEPRGEDGTALVERYGPGVLPWLADHLGEDGDLDNHPSLVLRCLLAIGTRKAFAVVWAVHRVNGSPLEAAHLLRQWLCAHPGVGFPLMADLAGEGDRRARKILRHLANRNPDRVFDWIRARLGKAATEALFEKLRIVGFLTESAILSLLDLCAERELDTEETPWPLFNSKKDGISVFHGMRLIAARAARGNGWGIVMERITGTHFRNAMVETYLYGSNVNPGLNTRHSQPLKFKTIHEGEEDTGLDGIMVKGPAGILSLANDMIGKYGLRTRNLGVRAPQAVAFILRLRAYLARYPGAFWIDAAQAAAPLSLGEDVDVVVETDHFTHVLGTDASDIPNKNKFWLARPSDTRVYRSLAKALVERNGSLFKPGKSNIDWW